jgi:chromosome segregation ATPase
MGISNGWNLSGRLIAKHFGGLGDKLAETIASFDPETATEADRAHLQEILQSTAIKVAQARNNFNKEHNDVVTLQEQIAKDEKAAGILADKLSRGEIDEATVNLFCDELEQEKKQLPQEVQEEAEAKQFLDEIESVLKEITSQLEVFDAQAKKALQTLAQAKAQRDLQELKLQRQNELDSLHNIGKTSTALSALSKKAEKINTEAEGMEIVNGIQNEKADKQNTIEEVRKMAEQQTTGTETAAERLKRLIGN